MNWGCSNFWSQTLPPTESTHHKLSNSFFFLKQESKHSTQLFGQILNLWGQNKPWVRSGQFALDLDRIWHLEQRIILWLNNPTKTFWVNTSRNLCPQWPLLDKHTTPALPAQILGLRQHIQKEEWGKLWQCVLHLSVLSTRLPLKRCRKKWFTSAQTEAHQCIIN